MYKYNKDLFEGEHAEVYEQAFKRIKRVISNFDEVVSFSVVVNYQKLISIKLADLLLGEEFKVVAGKDDSPEQAAVTQIIENTDLFNTGYMAVIDTSRFGDGLLIVYKDGDKGMIDVSQPPIWYPVVDPANLKRILYHVLAWVVEGGTEDNKTYTLVVQIHSKGSIEHREYKVDKGLGGTFYLKSFISRNESTKLDDFAVIQIPNIITSDRVHGMDDYTDIDSIMSELLVRLGQIARILDKHADPTVSGPMSALERDENGPWKLKLGGFLGRDGKDDAEPKYMVWDGQLEANFKFIEQLINFLHAVSEMGSQILGDKNDDSGVLSGTALRFKMVSPLSKAKRIANRLKPAMIKAIKLCSKYGGENIMDLSKTKLSINFLDGLPNDPVEESTIMMNRTGNKATMSVKTAIMTFDGKSEEDAENELEMIREDDAIANPVPDLLGGDPNADPTKKKLKGDE
jgi:(2Fe-2S) ferredoxin